MPPIVTTSGKKFLEDKVQHEEPPKQSSAEVKNSQTSDTAMVSTDEKQVVKFDLDAISSGISAVCTKLSTDTITVDMVPYTRKLDAGVVYYILHIKKPDTRGIPARKTGVYFTRVKDRIHVQVINGTSMAMLFTNYSENSQTEVLKYLENIVRKDIEFYNNAIEAKKGTPARKDGNRNHGRKQN